VLEDGLYLLENRDYTVHMMLEERLLYMLEDRDFLLEDGGYLRED
jgi:hypothetical protein